MKCQGNCERTVALLHLRSSHIKKIIRRKTIYPLDLPHPALGQDFTPSPTARRAQAGTGVRARSADELDGTLKPVMISLATLAKMLRMSLLFCTHFFIVSLSQKNIFLAFRDGPRTHDINDRTMHVCNTSACNHRK